jgi:hypothetical protein
MGRLKQLRSRMLVALYRHTTRKAFKRYQYAWVVYGFATFLVGNGRSRKTEYRYVLKQDLVRRVNIFYVRGSKG